MCRIRAGEIGHHAYVAEVRPKAFRRWLPQLWLTACVSVFFLIFLSGLFVTFDENQDLPVSLGQRVALAPLAAASLYLMVGIPRQGVFVSQKGLRIRNVFRTYEAEWNEIDRIEAPPSYGKFRNTGIGFVLRDGRRMNAGLFAAGPLNRKTFADPVLDELRAMHRDATVR